ncbi:MAG: N-acetylglucosamine-6-phosphate deacetylase [Candidatus Omnitrophica bacterium]|nr:N-acetylglucosamine-6-phosphate deacetylase [Candidatus Omnitrophota bacterium]
MADPITWLTNGKLITPRGIVGGAVGIRGEHLAHVGATPPRGDERISARGRYIAPGFIDLHIWGDPARVAAEEARTGTTGFLTAIGPESPELLVNHLAQLDLTPDARGARCLGIHLEGPFLNPLRAGALASRWLRPPVSRELRQLAHQAGAALRLITIAPEIPRGIETIRWCARHRVAVSLGHSDADAAATQRAISAGASAVTHVFNGMRPLHHRDPGLLGEVLTDDRLTAMIVLDGIHVDPRAFQFLVRCKGPDGVVLATDSVRHQPFRQSAYAHGAYRLKGGVLAGSALTMIQAVRNAVVSGKIPLHQAVQMASFNPARLIHESPRLGSLEAGKRADLVVFDDAFRVWMTLVDGRVVYRRGR